MHNLILISIRLKTCCFFQHMDIFIKQMGESGFFANSSDAMPALYEKMLKTSVEGPERIKDIGYVLKMVTDKDIIPDEFRELYETFCNTLKIRR